MLHHSILSLATNDCNAVVVPLALDLHAVHDNLSIAVWTPPAQGNPVVEARLVEHVLADRDDFDSIAFFEVA